MGGVIEDMGPVDSVKRMQSIAKALVEIVRQNDGVMSAEEAARSVASSLKMTVDQVMYGLVYGERVGALESTNNSADLKVA